MDLIAAENSLLSTIFGTGLEPGQFSLMGDVQPGNHANRYCGKESAQTFAGDNFHGMEEIIGSIPIRSTKQPLEIKRLR
jgi:hypothetical protein